MRDYADSQRNNLPIIAMVLYKDGITLAKSGAQSICIIRMRLLNLRGISGKWHDLSLAPDMTHIPGFINAKIEAQRSLLFQRFLFLVLEDTISAKKTGIELHGVLFFRRFLPL